jgi:hypothetical protein
VNTADLLGRARRLAEPGRRRVLGITGAGCRQDHHRPADRGFHLSNATLIAWGRRDRKGAWDTFDADGY